MLFIKRLDRTNIVYDHVQTKALINEKLIKEKSNGLGFFFFFFSLLESDFKKKKKKHGKI